jgi:purine-nucleoside phosphorylase
LLNCINRIRPRSLLEKIQTSNVKKPSERQLAARKLKTLSRLRPTLAIVLGSGFHHTLNALKVDARIAYTKLPGFPPVGVSGHRGEVLIAKLGRTPVLILSGRCHFYEGHEMERVTFAVRVLAEYGVRDLLLTNAAGGVNKTFMAGDFMALTDHINFMGVNPLRGPCEAGLQRFIDLSRIYDLNLNSLLQKAARQTKVRLRRGVYLAVSGPSYETPAEIRAFAKLGADAVGMSTVPEAIVARQYGLNVAGLSCITNLAAGRTAKTLSHGEVLETAERVQNVAANLLRTFAEFYGQRGRAQNEK